MVRNMMGSLLALIAAAAAVWSSLLAWLNGREGQDFGLADLFTADGVAGGDSGLWTGLWLPMAVAALLTVVGVILRSMILVGVAGLLVLGFTVLWLVRRGVAEGSLTLGTDSALEWGVWIALGSGIVLLLGAAVMRGRRKRRGRHREATPDEQLRRDRGITDERRTPGTGTAAGTGAVAGAGAGAAGAATARRGDDTGTAPPGRDSTQAAAGSQGRIPDTEARPAPGPVPAEPEATGRGAGEGSSMASGTTSSRGRGQQPPAGRGEPREPAGEPREPAGAGTSRSADRGAEKGPESVTGTRASREPGMGGEQKEPLPKRMLHRLQHPGQRGGGR